MKNIGPGDQTLVREINLTSVLDYLHTRAPLSRAQLATLTNLNKSTVSSLIDELLIRGLVIETGLGPAAIGRPGKLLEINPQAGSIIGLELGVDFILVVVSDFLGQITWRQKVATQADAGQEAILVNAFRLVDEAVTKTRAAGSRLLGIGLTLPGLVDIKKGELIYSPNLGWRNVPLRQTFTDALGVPVFVDNDASAAALGEHLFGVARLDHNFLFVLIGVGLGGGLFLNGDVYRGFGGYAGEIGHMVLGPDLNRPCRCGNRGCWETFSNQYSLIERVHARLEIGRRSIISSLMEENQNQLSTEIITQAAQVGDLVALEALRETGEAIGLGIANLIDLLNPQLVVVGGAMSIASQFLLPSMKTTIQGRALPEPYQQTRLVISKFGMDASVMGAVAMVVRAFLAEPTRAEIAIGA